MAAARTARFDLVLSQHAISAVAAGRLKRRLGVPVVLNFLDYLTGFMETWPVWLMPPPLLAVLKRYEVSMPCRFTADGVLTVSDPLADLIAKAGYPRERLLPIYYGCDCDLFTLDEEALAARTDAPPTIVMHGSLDHHHLGGIALEAIRRIHARRPEAVFKFVGRPTAPLEHLVRRVRQCAPAARLQRAGFVPYDAVARELAQASVGIVPYEESTGTHCAFVAKTVEYLRVGLPVASTPLESAVRYYRDEPLIRFSTFDGASLGDQVLSWLHEPTESRLAWGRAASQRVGENLDWRAICRKAVDFVEQVWHQAVGRSRH
jgi:glycosyltransferase involved in cell wall biosynthesis